MIELDLLGVGADGQTLVFTDANGERYSVAITDELRGSVRRNRPNLEAIPAPGDAPLRPKDIQALLRSGATPSEIARDHGVEVADIARFEGPVRAEQTYALSRAQQWRIGNEPDAPTMGDLVVDRLAARGVDPHSLSWTATREGTEPWNICLTFIQGANEHAAHWKLLTTGTLEALDQEASWLTETVSQSPSASIFTPLPPQTFTRDEADADEVRSREALLDQINAARGKRQSIDIEGEDDDLFLYHQATEGTDTEASRPSSPGIPAISLIHNADTLSADSLHDTAETDKDSASPENESISARIYSLTHLFTDKDEATQDSADNLLQVPSPSSDSEDPQEKIESSVQTSKEADSDTLPGLDALTSSSSTDTPKSDSSKKKSRRRSVPSWDEIVFGSKPN